MILTRGRVLVVEDEIEVAATLLELLVERNYEVLTPLPRKRGSRPYRRFGRTSYSWISPCRHVGPSALTVFRRAHPASQSFAVTSAVDAGVLAKLAEMEPFTWSINPSTSMRSIGSSTRPSGNRRRVGMKPTT